MAETRIVELPADAYRKIETQAIAHGTTTAAWIVEKLIGNMPPAPEQTREEWLARLESCISSSSRPAGTNNEDIDRDLAKEYGRGLTWDFDHGQNS